MPDDVDGAVGVIRPGNRIAPDGCQMKYKNEGANPPVLSVGKKRDDW